MTPNLPTPLPKRLNVGCGYDIRRDYLNVDLVGRHNPDLVADATNLPMLPSGHFDEVVAQDVWEHFERAKTAPALAEWARLLSPAGSLFIRIPSLLHLVDMLLAAERSGAAPVKEVLHLMYGTQAYTGDYHLTGFTPAVLEDLFAGAGLIINEVQLTHGWLYDITASHGGAVVTEWPDARIRCLENETGALRKENERLRATVAVLHQSTSWRITAPLRTLAKSARRWRQPARS